MEQYIYLEDLIKEVNTYADKRGLSLRLPNYDEITYPFFLDAYVEKGLSLENKKLVLLNMWLVRFIYPAKVNNKLISLPVASCFMYSKEEKDNKKILVYSNLRLDDSDNIVVYLTSAQLRDIKQEVKELNKLFKLIIKRQLTENTQPPSLIYPDKQFNFCNIKHVNHGYDTNATITPIAFKKDAHMIIQEWDDSTTGTKKHNTLVDEYMYDFGQEKAYTLNEGKMQ